MRDVAFCLPAAPLGGGSNSVVQEFRALVENFGLGWLVTDVHRRDDYRAAYEWSDRTWSRVLHQLEEVPDRCALVATTASSVPSIVAESNRRHGMPCLYYVQDYEPLFFAPGSRPHRTASDSFGLANSLTAVVKTSWLQQIVLRNSFLPVTKIPPSIDRRIFSAQARALEAGPRRVVAMLRPDTARRGPRRTAAALNRLAEERPEAVVIDVFGADAGTMTRSGLMPRANVRTRGVLRPTQVARLMREADLFVDLSDYQAFGRSVAEGMACGAVPVATSIGAIPELVRDGFNGFLVDPFRLDAAFKTLSDAVELDDESFQSMRRRAISSVASLSAEATAAGWVRLLDEFGVGLQGTEA